MTKQDYVKLKVNLLITLSISNLCWIGIKINDTDCVSKDKTD